MKIQWSYNLPTPDSSEYYMYGSPIFADKNEVLFAYEYKQNAKLFVIDANTGKGTQLPLNSSVSVLPKDYFFISFSNRIVFYAGDLFCYCSKKAENVCKLSEYGKVISHLAKSDLLYIICSKAESSTLLCFDMNTLHIRWKCDVTSKPYIAGPITVFENNIACYGCNKLLFIEPESGEFLSSIQISRVGKLFCPIRLDKEHIAIGYTNWSNAGILAYNTKSKKVKWKTARRFEGPLLRCCVYKRHHDLYWVKNDRELICIDENNGTEIFSISTSPWLYTDLCIEGDKIIFGTSGADGSLNCFRSDNGEKIWKIPLKNGCEYYGKYNDSLIAGDFSKTIKQIDMESGAILQEMQTEGEVVGQISIFEQDIYTVVLGDKNRSAALVKLALK